MVPASRFMSLDISIFRCIPFLGRVCGLLGSHRLETGYYTIYSHLY